ncbi:MAG: DHA2 family efflux MFS transporter permease subunit [Actinophytocola sp.]|uniref:DHA2 family efflux MFS transporter permease subunit n=1 Tax=Actinophytocola sp. TaxID=1872138 RepID=UPI003C73C15D
MTEVLPPTPSTAGTGSEKLDRRILAIGSVVVLGAVMAMLDITVVNVAIDHLIGEFDTTLNTIQWVATGYTLALATVIPLSGWAADRFGTKRIYLTAVFLFMAGSALAGLSWSVESLILFRVLQGLGGGMLMPLGMTILTKAAGPERIGRVMSVIGVPMLLGPIVGPILGGWLVDDVSWRWIFFINVPVGILTLLLGVKLLEKDEPRPAEKLDVIGLLLLSPGLAALIYGLAQVPAHEGVGHPEVYLPAGIGAVLVATFIWHASRTKGALIDLKLFRDRSFSVAAVTMVLFVVAFFGSMLLMPLYFQQVRGEGALAAGLLLAPQGIGAMLMMPIAGLIVDRVGSARIAQLGIIVIVGSMVLFTQLEGDTSYMAIGSALFVMGLGMGMTMMPIMSAALKTLRQQDVARASTSLNIIQQVAASIGTALLSVILFNEMKERLAPLAANAPAGAAPDTSSITDLPEPIRSQVADLMSEAYSATFFWALILLALAFLPALLLPRGKGTPPAPEPAVAPLPADAEAPPVIDEPAAGRG